MIIQDFTSSVSAVGRLAAGLVGESRRSAHLFDLDAGSEHSGSVISRCGDELPLPDIEWLHLGAGMPCERCMGLSNPFDHAPAMRHGLGG